MNPYVLSFGGRSGVQLCILALVFGSFTSTSGAAATRLAPVTRTPRASAPTLRPGGAPIGVRLTAGANGEYFGAGILRGDAQSVLGSVVRIDPSGEVRVLHDFSGADGARPAGMLVRARDGFLYGVTSDGGASSSGTVYRVLPDGSGFSTVYSFTGGADGGRPLAGLVETRTGTLVGTASIGGEAGRGVIYQIDQTGSFRVIHSFALTEGMAPAASLMDPGTGLLYGTTQAGGRADLGTIFVVKPNGTSFRSLHEFAVAEGAVPAFELVRGADGLLYGTTSWGGVWNNGTMFRISPDGTRFERVRAFTASQRDTSALTDKSRPQSLAVARDGRVLGTAFTSVENRLGEVFSVRTDTAEYSVLYGFDGAGDPRGGLVRAADGNLFVPVFESNAAFGGAVMHLQPLDGSAGVASKQAQPVSEQPVAGAMRTDGTAGPTGQQACTNPWFSATSYPETICRYAFAQVGEDLYVMSGVDNGSVVNTCNRYNTGTNAWTPLAAVPIPGEASAAAQIGGKIYFAQGAGGNAFAIYDIAGNSWTSGPAVPVGADRYGAAAGAFNGNVFIVGGGSAGPTTDVEVYNIAGNSWSAGTAAPSGYLLGGYVQVGQYLYCIGSFGASPAANSTVSMRLDMSSAPGTWTVGPAWTPARADFGLASFGSKIYALGGEDNAGGFFDANKIVNELDVSAWPGGTWIASPPDLPGNRQGNQAGYLATTGRAGGEIWSTGGVFGRNVHTFISEHVYRPQGADVTPPTLTCPGNITVGENPSGSGGAVVNYTASATDNCSTPSVVCSPPSGSTFPLGTTSVTCTAMDGSDNTATCSFQVSVVTSTFTVCCVDDGTGNIIAIDTNPMSGNYGAWQLTIVATGQTVTGVAEYVHDVPGHSLIAYDHDGPTSRLDLNLNYASHTCTATIRDLTNNARYVIRDRNILNNPPCTGGGQM